MKVFGIIGAMDIEIQLIKGNMIITNKKQYAGSSNEKLFPI